MVNSEKKLWQNFDKQKKEIEAIDKVVDDDIKVGTHETNYVIKLFLPIIEYMGWDVNSNDVIFEAPAKDIYKKFGWKKARRVDISLGIWNGKRYNYKVLIEAKKGDKINDGDINQLNEYIDVISCYSKIGKIRYGILLTKWQIGLYDKQYVKEGASPHLLCLISLEDQVSFCDGMKILEVFSRENIEKKKTDNILNKFKKRWKDRIPVLVGNLRKERIREYANADTTVERNSDRNSERKKTFLSVICGNEI